jgi:peroxiredoxin
LTAGLALAQELKAGDQAHDFNPPGTDGKTYSLADLKGKSVVLVWVPKRLPVVERPNAGRYVTTARLFEASTLRIS